MRIIIIRHEKVDMGWDKKYNSVAYDLACDKYDRCSIVPERKANFEIGEIKTIYISELLRTYETACKIFGKINFLKTPLLNEVPLKSFKDTEHMYPLWLWNLMGRLQWFIQNKRQVEGKKETIVRASQMIDLLEKNQDDCCVITHGFYMRTFIKELKTHGYKIERSNLLGISNLDKIIAIKY